MRARATKRIRPTLESLEGRALLTAGALDTTFGGTGTVITNATTVTASEYAAYQYATGVVVQPDLKTIVVGVTPETYQTGTRRNSTSTHLDILVARYNTDGSLDTTFGTGGLVRIRCHVDDYAGAGWDPHLISVALEPNGDIVIAGDTQVTYAISKKTSVTRYDLYVARLTPNGAFDTTFNGTGSEVIDFPQGNVYAEGVAIQPSTGDIIVGADSGATGLHFLAVRLNPNGGLDKTFGPNGQGYVGIASGTAQAMTLDGSGNILLAGYETNPATGVEVGAVVRYTPSGLPDTTFGSNGEALVAGLSPTAFAELEAIGMQSNQIVVSGDFLNPATGNTYGAAVVRLNADGSVDDTFGPNGNGIDYDWTMFHPEALAIQPNDEILVAGTGISNGSTYGYFVDRLTATGLPDTAFGVNGQAQALFGTGYSGPAAMTLGPDGKITVTGGVGVPVSGNNYEWFGTARFLNDITSNTSTTATSALASASAPSPGLVPVVVDSRHSWGILQPIAKRHLAPG